MLVDWSILTPILIAIFSAVGVFAFSDFKTFEFYINYFYVTTSAIFIFMMGWNTSLLYFGDKNFIVNWWLVFTTFMFIVYVRVIFKISETKFYKGHIQPW